MKVKCKTNKAGEAFKDMSLPFGTSRDSTYGVDVDDIYTVVGMIQSKWELCYFIFNGSYPVIYPVQLFEIVDFKISKNWFFKQYSLEEDSPVDAVWGYYEFCFDESHYEKIIDYDKEELAIFHSRLKEMEAE